MVPGSLFPSAQPKWKVNNICKFTFVSKFQCCKKAVIGLYYFHHAFNNPVDVCMVCMTVRTDCSPFLFASGYLLYTPWGLKASVDLLCLLARYAVSRAVRTRRGRIHVLYYKQEHLPSSCVVLWRSSISRALVKYSGTCMISILQFRKSSLFKVAFTLDIMVSWFGSTSTRTSRLCVWIILINSNSSKDFIKFWSATRGKWTSWFLLGCSWRGDAWTWVSWSHA